MKEYIITRCAGTPDWSAVPALQISELHHTPEGVPVRAWAQVCCDDEKLYVRMEAEEKDVRATYSGLLDEVCEDSCLEFFLSPAENDNRYFNIEMNPNGAMYFGFGTCCENLIRLICQECPVIVPEITKTEKGWFVNYTIPYWFLRLFFPAFEGKKGDTIRGNFFTCGEQTDPKHFLCWCPVVPRPHAFHNPDCFGKLIFG